MGRLELVRGGRDGNCEEEDARGLWCLFWRAEGRERGGMAFGLYYGWGVSEGCFVQGYSALMEEGEGISMVAFYS